MPQPLKFNCSRIVNGTPRKLNIVLHVVYSTPARKLCFIFGAWSIAFFGPFSFYSVNSHRATNCIVFHRRSAKPAWCTWLKVMLHMRALVKSWWWQPCTWRSHTPTVQRRPTLGCRYFYTPVTDAETLFGGVRGILSAEINAVLSKNSKDWFSASPHMIGNVHGQKDTELWIGVLLVHQ